MIRSSLRWAAAIALVVVSLSMMIRVAPSARAGGGSVTYCYYGTTMVAEPGPNWPQYPPFFRGRDGYYVDWNTAPEGITEGECAPATEEPTLPPTEEPTLPPTEEPTIPPTEEPTIPPTEEPTLPPTEEPTLPPTEEPTIPPTVEPTTAPTEEPTIEPTETVTVEPSPSATTPPEDHVTICHALGNGGFQQISPDAEGVYKGHLGHQGGRDIIPPFTYDGTVYSQNWDETGQAIWNNGCEVSTATATVEPTETVTVEPTEVPSETATVEPTTTVPVETPTVEPTETATVVPTVTVEPTTPAETPTIIPVEPTQTPDIGEPPTIPAPGGNVDNGNPPTPPATTGANQLPVTGTGSGSSHGINWAGIVALLFGSVLALAGSAYFRRRSRAT